MRTPSFPTHLVLRFLPLACCTFLHSSLWAQLPSAGLNTIFPPGGVAGQTIEVNVAGTNLYDLDALVFNHPGIKGEPVMLPATEFQKAPRQSGNKCRVTIDAKVPPGLYEVRASGLYGLSTPRAFQVTRAGTVEIADTNANDPTKAPALALEAVATGTCDANQIDYYQITLKRGQRVLIHVWAERLDSRADATLLIRDKEGRQLEYNRDTVGRDPMIDFTAPQDDTYLVGVHDFLFLGGAEFPYRLTVTERPWIDYVYPPAGVPGQEQSFTLHGRNLPGGSLDGNLSLEGKPIETLSIKVKVPSGASGAPALDPERPTRAMLPGFDYQLQDASPIRIGFLNAPMVKEDPKSSLQTVNVPCEIVGIFDTAGDDDAYRFTAKKDTVWWIEAIADRLAGRSDPYLVVEKITKDKEGKETFTKVVESDDLDLAGTVKTFDGATRDARLTFKADQDGDYRVTLANQYGSGGADHLYRLAIRQPQPDFQLLAISEQAVSDGKGGTPQTPLLRQNGTVAFQILVDRIDGLDTPIVISAVGLPPGVTCPPVTVHANQSTAFVVLQAAPDAAKWAGYFQLVGKTTPPGKAEISHEARNGTLVWKAADLTKERIRTRLTTQLALAVTAAEKAPVVLSPAEVKPWSVEIGQKLEIPLKLGQKGALKGPFTVETADLPGLAKPATVAIDEKKDDGKLTLDFAPTVFKGQPGSYSLVLKGTGTVKYRINAQAVTLAEEEKKLVESLLPKIAEAATKAKANSDAALKALDEAKKLAAAATPEAKASADQKVSTAQAALDTAKKAQTEAEAKSAAATKEKGEADKRLQAATTLAKETDTKFAAFSLPLTLEVKPAPVKK